MRADPVVWWVLVGTTAFVWLAVAVLSGSYFVAVGVPIFLALALLADVPARRSDETEGSGGGRRSR